jgi:hypothetical protein
MSPICLCLFVCGSSNGDPHKCSTTHTVRGKGEHPSSKEKGGGGGATQEQVQIKHCKRHENLLGNKPVFQDS